jgi:hypothetical protein
MKIKVWEIAEELRLPLSGLSVQLHARGVIAMVNRVNRKLCFAMRRIPAAEKLGLFVLAWQSRHVKRLSAE